MEANTKSKRDDIPTIWDQISEFDSPKCVTPFRTIVVDEDGWVIKHDSLTKMKRLEEARELVRMRFRRVKKTKDLRIGTFCYI